MVVLFNPFRRSGQDEFDPCLPNAGQHGFAEDRGIESIFPDKKNLFDEMGIEHSGNG